MGQPLASKKDKILESAQRFVLKGQLDKAIKDYQQVVVLDPKEIRHRQRLAELLVRDNRKEEAIVQYEDIGKHYAENSYLLKAIAVYKQIQRLVPQDTAISLTLAALNNKQGLTGNALAEYGQVAAQFEKDGALKESIKVLEEMLAIDGVTSATRLKYAELLFATRAEDHSFQVFSALRDASRDAGDDAAVQMLSDQMRELFPNREIADDSLHALIERAEPTGTAAERQENSAGQQSAMEQDASEISVRTVEQAVVEDVVPAFEAPSAFDLPGLPEAPPATPALSVPQTTGPTVAWEEEIELDLDYDLDEELGEELGEPASAMDLSLDFSVSLDFDESAQTGQSDSPFADDDSALTGTEVVAFDLEQGGSLELNWPEEIDISLDDELEDATAIEQAAEIAQAAEQLLSESRQLRGWQEIFPESEGPANAALDLDELESHYDLGIAYKEMGLFGDAIKEFTVAAGNHRRRLDCLTLQAICFREKGEASKAEELLQRGLSLEVLSVAERMSLSYELAFLHETSGDLDEAINLYREVHEFNPAFHDVAHRLSSLVGEGVLDIIELELEDEEDY